MAVENIATAEWLAYAFVLAGVLLAVVGGFVLRALENEPPTDQRNPGGKWTFPPKEDKVARGKRWAKVMGKNFKPVRVLTSQRTSELDVPAVLAAFARSEVSEETLRTWKGSLEMEKLPLSILGTVRERIFRILIDSGPPRSLCPITEAPEDKVALEANAAEVPEGKARRALEADQSSITIEAAEPTVHAPYLESEPVILVGQKQIARETLWAALALLEATMARSMLQPGGHEDTLPLMPTSLVVDCMI